MEYAAGHMSRQPDIKYLIIGTIIPFHGDKNEIRPYRQSVR
jgi:hypothetical protein